MTVWFRLHTASYWGKTQGIGVVFSREKFAEWQRHGALAEQASTLASNRLDLCADPIVDWVVSLHPIAGIAPLTVAADGALYACSSLRPL
jgi:hypothetical protein